MREKTIEMRLKDYVKSAGGMYIKLTGLKGIPDRLVCLPGGLACFMELKAEGEVPRPIQFVWLERLKALGFVAVWVDSFDKGRAVVDELMGIKGVCPE